MNRIISPALLTLLWASTALAQAAPTDPNRDGSRITCAGVYPKHLQGICVDNEAIFWSFTDRLVKTDHDGTMIKNVRVADHHGDLCCRDGKLFVAVNLGKFNDPAGQADSWVYIYDAATLAELAKHQVSEVVYGAGGIGTRDGRFFVVGGLPSGINENYVYEYDDELKFIKKHTLNSGWTRLGIQTATFAQDRWWFGCYGNPKILLIADANFTIQGKYPFDCSLGIAAATHGHLWSASGQCRADKGCTGWIQLATPDATSGLRYATGD